MEVIQTLCQISAELLDCFFWEFFVLFDQLVEVTAGAVFEYDPKMVACLIPIVELKDVSIFQAVEDANFIQHLFAPILFDGLDSDVVYRLFLSALFRIQINISKFATILSVSEKNIRRIVIRRHNLEEARQIESQILQRNLRAAKTYLVDDRVLAASDFLVDVKVVHSLLL